MFCTNCGAKIANEQAAFCSQCGAQRRAASVSASSTASSAPVVQRKREKIVRSVPASSIKKWNLFSYFGCLILCLISMFLDIFKAELLGMVDYRIGDSKFSSSSFLLICSILFLIAFAGLALFPIMNQHNFRRVYFLPSKIYGFVYLLLLLGVWLSAISDAKRYEGLVQIGLSIGGWLFALAHIGVLVISFGISFDIKRLTKAQR